MKMIYESPELEILKVAVEEGFSDPRHQRYRE